MASKTWIIAAAAVIALPHGASAADQAPACTTPGSLPTELAAWATPVARTAAASAAHLPDAALVIGQAATVPLMQTPSVVYPRRPEKPAGAASFGGLLQVAVAARGTYRVALGSAAWIDLVDGNGTAVVSAAHSHGPACSGVHKIVDFVLAPGTYILQISGNADRVGKVLVVRLPG